MELTEYILRGGGEHARVVVDCLLAQGADIRGIFDPKYKGALFGVPQLGEYNPDYEPAARAILAIGDNRVRKKAAGSTKHGFGIVMHPSAIVSTFSTVGVGSMVLHGSIVQAQTKIGDHVILNTGCRVDHDNIIEDFVHIGPGSILCGVVHVGEGTLIGAGSTILLGTKIGSWATIGAGSVVIDDIPDYAVAVGNPARIIKYNKP